LCYVKLLQNKQPDEPNQRHLRTDDLRDLGG
jgi:hypothetical protein